MAVIDYRLLPKILTASAKGMKTATRNTLNDVAFLARKEITKQANSDMDISGNANNALGFRINKANYGKLVAEIYTTRGWLYYHLSEGKRQAKSGFVWKGQSWIIVPIVESAFTVRGKLKPGFAKNIFVIPRGSKPLLAYRNRRGKRVTTIIASLNKRVEHNEDTAPEVVIQKVMRRDGKRILLEQLKRYKSR